jgi:hypothetical protein
VRYSVKDLWNNSSQAEEEDMEERLAAVVHIEVNRRLEGVVGLAKAMNPWKMANEE